MSSENSNNNNSNTKLSPPQNQSKEKKKEIMVELTERQRQLLYDIIIPHYRTSNMSHAVRLMIEDHANSIIVAKNKS